MSDSQISYNFHTAYLRRDGEVIAEVHTSVDRDPSEPLFFLTGIDHYAASGKTDEQKLCIRFSRQLAFLIANAWLQFIDDRKGGQIEIPPGFPGDERIPVRRRGTMHVSKGRAVVFEDTGQ